MSSIQTLWESVYSLQQNPTKKTELFYGLFDKKKKKKKKKKKGRARENIELVDGIELWESVYFLTTKQEKENMNQEY